MGSKQASKASYTFLRGKLKPTDAGMTAVRMTPWGSSLQCQQGRVPAEPKSVFGSVKLNQG